MNRKKICIIACGQLSTNPRALKELRALKEAGYDVFFIGSYSVNWALEYDARIITQDGLKASIINWSKRANIFLSYKIRLRHFIARKLYSKFGFSFLEKYVLHPVYPEIKNAVLRERADLYIAHNLSALPAASAAAREYQAKLGFDAEDFYGSGLLLSEAGIRFQRLAESIQMKYLARCDYISASSDAIALAYARKYGLKKPFVLHNVFPLSYAHALPLPAARDNLSLYWFSQTIGEKRGLEDIMLAMGRVKADVRLYLQGNISKNYKRSLQRLARESNLREDKIIFLAPAFPDDLVNIASAFDVGLAMEEREPLNRDMCVTNKVFLYLLAGLSVIATETQGQKPIVESIGKAGWLYKCGDINALAERIDFLALNKTALEESKQEALKYGRERYNWDLEKHNFLTIVSGVLG